MLDSSEQEPQTDKHPAIRADMIAAGEQSYYPQDTDPHVQSIDSVLAHVSIARNAIALAGQELRAGLAEAGIDEYAIKQVIDAEAITGSQMLSTALIIQQALHEVDTLDGDLRQEKKGYIVVNTPDIGQGESENM